MLSVICKALIANRLLLANASRTGEDRIAYSSMCHAHATKKPTTTAMLARKIRVRSSARWSRKDIVPLTSLMRWSARPDPHREQEPRSLAAESVAAERSWPRHRRPAQKRWRRTQARVRSHRSLLQGFV